MICFRSLSCILALIGCLISFQIHAESKTVYLTFDDGPMNSTLDILNLLVKEKVPGTFFLVGEHILIDSFKKETFHQLKSSPLAQIGNHSFSHAYNERYSAFYRDDNGMLQDFQKNNELLGLLKPPFIARLPSRSDWCFNQFSMNAICPKQSQEPWCLHNLHFNSLYCPSKEKQPASTSIDKLFENGFIIYGWDIEWLKNAQSKVLDSPSIVVTEIKRRFNSKYSVKPGKVVLLMHDRHFEGKEGIDNIRNLIHLIRQEKYNFDSMDNY